MMNEVCVGVDVSKAELDVYCEQLGELAVPNTLRGFDQLLKRLQAVEGEPKLIVEASGGYEQAILKVMSAAGVHICLVNPRHVRAFAKGLGLLAKTDRLDARVLARFGAVADCRRYEAPSEERAHLSALTRRRSQLLRMRTAEKCILKQSSGEVADSVQEHIEQLDQHIQNVEREIASTFKRCEELKEQAELLRSIPGIGPVTVMTMTADLPELGQVSRRQIAALVGVAPFNHDSGKHSGQRTCWGGRGDIRRVLFMAVLASIRANSFIKAHYDGLISRGKAKYVAIVACMRKLLTIANAVVASQKPFDERLVMAT